LICDNVGIVYSGMGPDARVLVNKARKEAQKYKRVYGENPPAMVLVREIANIMQEYTQSGYVIDENTPTRLTCYVVIVVYGHLVSRCWWLALMSEVHPSTRWIHLVLTLPGKRVPSARIW
jgi:hypothetical protein